MREASVKRLMCCLTSSTRLNFSDCLDCMMRSVAMDGHQSGSGHNLELDRFSGCWLASFAHRTSSQARHALLDHGQKGEDGVVKATRA